MQARRRAHLNSAEPLAHGDFLLIKQHVVNGHATRADGKGLLACDLTTTENTQSLVAYFLLRRIIFGAGRLSQLDIPL